MVCGNKRVARQGVGLGDFAGVHVRFAGVTGGIDDETPACVVFKNSSSTSNRRVIHFLARKRRERPFAALQFARERLADITRCTEEQNHKFMIDD